MLDYLDENCARDLAEKLTALGAEVRYRELDNACECPRCKSFLVIKIDESPKGFRVYCCAKCGEIKRACPSCGDQGWLVHFHSDQFSCDWYECDECYATYSMDWKCIEQFREIYDCREITDYF